jgi:hypothetical protein
MASSPAHEYAFLYEKPGSSLVTPHAGCLHIARFVVRCTCGWTSSEYTDGSGERGEAITEWRVHAGTSDRRN